jgi:hypothetical protein
MGFSTRVALVKIVHSGDFKVQQQHAKLQPVLPTNNMRLLHNIFIYYTIHTLLMLHALCVQLYTNYYYTNTIALARPHN